MTSTEDGAHLRRATTDDAGIIAALNEHVQRLHVEAVPAQFVTVDRAVAETFFSAQLADEGNIVWIAEVGGQPVGYLYAVEAHRGVNPFTTEQHTLYIHHLAVDPAVRRRGVGSAMIAAAETYARDRGLSGLRLDSWLFNAEAHAFFRGLGFEPVITRFARDL
ncbi:GNAT family N-acetyltransferase [Cellulomonas sp.]|uniref:GNAT family N-acetyltransferase n=1 Tax=Cellulomonas sp. TaxID=40001 RepID=UPI003BAB6B9F